MPRQANARLAFSLACRRAGPQAIHWKPLPSFRTSCRGAGSHYRWSRRSRVRSARNGPLAVVRTVWNGRGGSPPCHARRWVHPGWNEVVVEDLDWLERYLVPVSC